MRLRFSALMVIHLNLLDKSLSHTQGAQAASARPLQEIQSWAASTLLCRAQKSSSRSARLSPQDGSRSYWIRRRDALGHQLWDMFDSVKGVRLHI